MAYGTANPPLEGAIRKVGGSSSFLMGPSSTNQPPLGSCLLNLGCTMLTSTLSLPTMFSYGRQLYHA
jgi:hypothetical protein